MVKTKVFTHESNAYIAIWVKDSTGENPRCLLFTERDVQRAEERALKNTEDFTKRSWLSKLLDQENIH